MGDFFQPGCAVCQRLWHKYADATTTHIKLTGQQRIAALQHNYELAASLETQVADADHARCAAREAIACHEDEHKAKT